MVTDRLRFQTKRVEETGSTNADLLALARSGAPDGTVLVADHQSAGRGRLGRTWDAPAGSSLLVSVLLRPGEPAERRHLLAMAVAVAAAQACERVADVSPGLKWPNDLVVADRKLAGILAEANPPDDVVVGIGVNVNWDGAIPADGVALNQLAGRRIDRDELLDALLDGLAELYANRELIRSRYEARSATLGRAVRVETPGGVLAGTATRLTAEGHLVVTTASGDTTVTVGDVRHLRPAD